MTSENDRPQRGNNYPIVLVVGFAGWGREELLGFKYWGGFHDIEDDLAHQYNGGPYSTYTAAVGPVSSNWDRACELYAMLKGGQVDYGVAHAARYQHERYGRTYPGLIPLWGDADPIGNRQKVHLVGHSQGGQTARTLIQLLEQGDADEIRTTSAPGLSPLFQGGKQWVHSATTIATPHDGTTLVYGVTSVVPFVQQIITFLAAINGAGEDLVYDLKLDQWNLKRAENESLRDYVARVAESEIWESTHDLSSWDLSIEGASELNSRAMAAPEVFYFSWATRSTINRPILGCVPRPTTFPPFLATSAFMTHYRGNHGVPADAWWPNDGVVNTVSMDGPRLGSTDSIVSFGQEAQPGVWNYMGLMDGYDHADIIGIGTIRDVRDWYRRLADRLGALPA
jgi:triacylglycerol lipase